MKRAALIILFSFVVNSVYSQETELDSLKSVLVSSEGIEKIDVLNELVAYHLCSEDSLAMIYSNQLSKLLSVTDYPMASLLAFKHSGQMNYCSGKLDSTIFYYKKALIIGEDHALNKESIRLASNLGFYFQFSSAFDSSTYYFQKGLLLAKEIGDSLVMGAVYLGMATNFQQKGEIDTAVKFNFDALKIAEGIDQKSLFVAAKLNIANCYYEHQPQKIRISDFLELLALTREIGDIHKEAEVLEYLGYIEADSGDYELAIKHLEQGLESNKIDKDSNIEIRLLEGLAHAHQASGDYKQSISINNEVIDLAMISDFRLYLPTAYASNVSNYLSLKDYKNAIENGLKAIQVGEASGQKELYYNVLPDLALAYNALGETDKAYEAQLEYSRLSKEILDVEKSKQLTEIETKYETEKKETEIAYLSQQAAIQKLELQQKNQAIIIGLIVFLFALAVLLFYYKQRGTKKQQIQTELEQRFLRSQLNPHFISNALVSVQTFMLKNDSKSATMYLAKFSKLMREILENSRKEFIPVEDEVSMLTNYLDIHQLKSKDSFSYQIKIDDQISLEEDTIPPMFIQPFVENAIEHGIINLDGDGEINIVLKKEGEYIAIEVRDNGGGLAKQETTTDHQSLSSTIIRERMDLFNQTLKNKIELVLDEIKNDKGEVQGTRVALKVPYGYI